MFRNKKSIIFIRPDYHCSFFYRNELRKLGWKADIYAPWDYPTNFLYSENDILRPPFIKGKFDRVKWINHFFSIIWLFLNCWRYKYFSYYGPPPVFTFFENKLGLTKLFGKDFLIELWLIKLFGGILIYSPTGCKEEESKENFSKLDNGHVCANCGIFEQCNDKKNNLKFSFVRRYFSMGVGWDPLPTTQYDNTHFKYKCIDLSLWNSNIAIPEKYKLPATDKIRILHSFVPSGRLANGKNIKGSQYVLEAVDRLKKEGYPVEYTFFSKKKSNIMRFYQVQADIVVEQLIYGWWGSTGVETMALGKPVICYLRKEWKDFFFQTFPEYNEELPIIEANKNTVYQKLKELVEDERARKIAGDKSRKFAEKHFNPQKNAEQLQELLLNLNK